MALNPRFSGARLTATTSPTQALHTLEFYLDYVCPFSKKQFDTVYTHVFPLLTQKYPNKLQIVFRQQIQPWHPSSTLVHEAGLAVLRTKPDAFWHFSKALFAAQTEYFDEAVVNEARNETYKRLAKLAGSVGVDEGKVYGLLEISAKPGKDGGLNGGNQVTNDVKLITKEQRLRGVHVTPTVVFNGLLEPSISSSFTKEDWEGWLEKNVA
ncbi:Thioredoxin [Teratosphaeria destructans]|uniref:Thioredoxin n=1 Tax=Teratosphaeria destructans TaxID=418781 RepID=A0A9W7SXM4_9PEZI|nr:Thioredoxin [Teratosphaeria destructans]